MMPADDTSLPPAYPSAYRAASELFPAVPPPLAPAAAYQLRPLSVGEVLDRTFALYRSRFWLFAGIASISGAVQMVLRFVQLFTTKLTFSVARAGAINPLETMTTGGLSLLYSLAFLLIYSVTQAATVYAVSENYLGRTTTVGASMKATIGRWYRYIGIALWQAWSAMWLLFVVLIPAIVLIAIGGTAGKVAGGILAFVGVLGGMVYAVIAYLRNSLAIQASVMETLGVRKAMRRSKVLAAGAKGRIFVVLLVVFCMLLVAGMIEAPMLLFVVRSPGERHIGVQSVMLLVNFFAHVVVTPVGLVGLSLLYFDQRVRKEGFDLLMMLGPEVPVAATASESVMATPVSDAAGI